VIARFALCTIIPIACVAPAGAGLKESLTVLLWMSTIIGAIFATIRREFELSNAIDHWDKAAAYLAARRLLTS